MQYIAMSYSFAKNTTPVRGFAGTRKVDVGLVFQNNPDKTKPLMMSIIKDNGQQVTAFPISFKKYQEIKADGFWVLPKQPFN